MMSASHDPVTVTTSVANEDNRQIWQTDVVSDLFEGTRIHERRDTVNPGPEASLCEPRCNADHVLFGDPGIDKAGLHLIAKRLKGFEAQIAGQEDELGAPCIPDERSAERFSHCSSTSRVAWRYCSSLMGK